MSNRKDWINVEIRRLNGEIAERQRAITTLREELARLACPFKLGQLITFRHGTTRVKAVIKNIQPGRYDEDYQLIASRVRADGSMGANVCILPWYHKPEAVPA